MMPKWNCHSSSWFDLQACAIQIKQRDFWDILYISSHCRYTFLRSHKLPLLSNNERWWVSNQAIHSCPGQKAPLRRYRRSLANAISQFTWRRRRRSSTKNRDERKPTTGERKSARNNAVFHFPLFLRCMSTTVCATNRNDIFTYATEVNRFPNVTQSYANSRDSRKYHNSYASSIALVQIMGNTTREKHADLF